MSNHPDFKPDYVIPGKKKTFKYWVQTVLPIVYDDSLSFMELLNKVVVYLNNTITDVNTLTEEFTDLTNAFSALQDYVNEYFDNLDIEEEINNKLDEMVEDGTFMAIIAPYLPFVTPEMFGAVGDDVADDTAAIQAAAAVGKPIVVTAGTYKITSAITLSGEIYICPGAILHMSAGTLTIPDSLHAGRYKIFEGTINISDNIWSYPEWFGAVADGSTDDISAIQAAINAAKKIAFGAGTYCISAPITLKNGSVIKGNHSEEGIAGDTVIEVTENVSAIDISGTSTAFRNTIDISHLFIRSVSTDKGAAGVRMYYCNSVNVSHVKVVNYQDAFFANHTVFCKIRDCSADISALSTAVNNRGFVIGDFDGHGNYNGNNASLYMSNNICIMHTAPGSLDEGLRILGYVSDVYVDSYESIGGRMGIKVSVDGEYFKRGQSNLWIRDAVIDGYTFIGIYLANIPHGGNIIIDNCYVSPAFNLTSYHDGIHVYQSEALVTLSNNQIVNYDPVQSIYPRGILIEASSNVKCVNNQVTNFTQPKMTAGTCKNIVFDDTIYNDDIVVPSACTIGSNTTNIKITDRIVGSANAITYHAWEIISGASKIYIDNSGLDPNMIAATGYPLKYNDASYNTIGLSADNKLYLAGFTF